MPHRFGVVLVLALTVSALAAFAAGCGEPQAAPSVGKEPVTEVSEAGSCENHQPDRQVLWGDLHVHTGVSMDAYMFGTRLRPKDAYAFARGETVRTRPFDENGEPTRAVTLDRPLDFAAITDHASNFGAVSLCSTPGSASYDSEFCATYRSPIQLEGRPLGEIVADIQSRSGAGLSSVEVCGENGERCRDAAIDVWQETQDAAAAYDDDTASCRFTTFVAYEYTATPNLSKIHRNVIFRNDQVPVLPIAYDDQPSAIGLWRDLKEQCLDAGTGCDVLAIPHNPNLSNGLMFALDYEGETDPAAQADIARLRAAMEPVVEMSQMKGDSECRNGMWNVLGDTDEFCDFEKIRKPESPDCEDGTGQGALAQTGCVSRRDFVRYALVDGLQEADRIGVNPYPFGFIAATDGHDGTPGAVEEDRVDLPMSPANPSVGRNLGGLAGVWAEENSRESIFNAIRRRETYGTSGPRISVRFFGGWDYDADLCNADDLVGQGYAGGVAMGGELAAPEGDDTAAPTFVVHAMRDPGAGDQPGTALQRVQIIKGWADAEGRVHQSVVDVAGGPNDASVDLATCAPQGTGHNALCGVWSDPDFDPADRAVYYARVLENPTCRQTGWACLAGPGRPAWCDSAPVPLTLQERAWTSPIWYRSGAPE